MPQEFAKPRCNQALNHFTLWHFSSSKDPNSHLRGWQTAEGNDMAQKLPVVHEGPTCALRAQEHHSPTRSSITWQSAGLCLSGNHAWMFIKPKGEKIHRAGDEDK